MRRHRAEAPEISEIAEIAEIAEITEIVESRRYRASQKLQRSQGLQGSRQMRSAQGYWRKAGQVTGKGDRKKVTGKGSGKKGPEEADTVERRNGPATGEEPSKQKNRWDAVRAGASASAARLWLEVCDLQ